MGPSSGLTTSLEHSWPWGAGCPERLLRVNSASFFKPILIYQPGLWDPLRQGCYDFLRLGGGRKEEILEGG